MSHPRTRKAGDKTLVILADSETQADLFYATRFLAGDPFLYVELRGEKLLIVKDLELGRAQLEAHVDRVVQLSVYEDRLRAQGVVPSLPRALDLFFQEARAPAAGEEVVVPGSFPLEAARMLESLGYRLSVSTNGLFPERAVKTAEEVACIEESQATAAFAVSWVIDRIRESEIRDGLLFAGGEPLTVEGLRTGLNKVLLDRGAIALSSIIAPGDQGCDPHLRGSGQLPAHQTIIIDVFPRSLRHRYWGDMTRTVVRGKASPEVVSCHRDVRDAQEMAMGMIRDGQEGQAVHQAVVEFFARRGRFTGERSGKKVGFFHGTGHGIGIDIHESPSMGKLPSRLSAGNVITVEPGLYYPGVGAVRIEDSVVVTRDGCRPLSPISKDLEV